MTCRYCWRCGSQGAEHQERWQGSCSFWSGLWKVFLLQEGPIQRLRLVSLPAFTSLFSQYSAGWFFALSSRGSQQQRVQHLAWQVHIWEQWHPAIKILVTNIAIHAMRRTLSTQIDKTFVFWSNGYGHAGQIHRRTPHSLTSMETGLQVNRHIEMILYVDRHCVGLASYAWSEAITLALLSSSALTSRLCLHPALLWWLYTIVEYALALLLCAWALNSVLMLVHAVQH